MEIVHLCKQHIYIYIYRERDLCVCTIVANKYIRKTSYIMHHKNSIHVDLKIAIKQQLSIHILRQKEIGQNGEMSTKRGREGGRQAERERETTMNQVAKEPPLCSENEIKISTTINKQKSRNQMQQPNFHFDLEWRFAFIHNTQTRTYMCMFGPIHTRVGVCLFLNHHAEL